MDRQTDGWIPEDQLMDWWMEGWTELMDWWME